MNRQQYIDFAKENQPYIAKGSGSYGYPSGESKYDLLKSEWATYYTELIITLQTKDVLKAISLEKELTEWIDNSPIICHLKIAVHSVLFYIIYHGLKDQHSDYCDMHKDDFEYVLSNNKRPSFKQKIITANINHKPERRSRFAKQFGKKRIHNER